jgi:hypothetical protein
MATNAQFHVNGLAELWGYAVVTDGDWDSVGYSQDGVTIELHYETDDIHTDKWGSKIPEDIMNLGQWATVKMNLIKYDTEALGVLEGRLLRDATAGKLPNVDSSGNLLIGSLMSQCDDLGAIAITRSSKAPGCEDSPLEGGWQFNAAYLADVDSYKVGTRVTIHDVTFRCLPDASGVLFTVIGTGQPSG